MKPVTKVYLDELRKAHGDIGATLRVLRAVEKGQYIPLGALLESARSTPTDIILAGGKKPDGYIFASGEIDRLEGEGYDKYITMLTSGELHFISIGHTKAALFLRQQAFYLNLRKTIRSEKSNLTEAQILHGQDKPDGTRTPGLWDDISRGYAKNARGMVITVSPHSHPQRVLVKSELPELIKNEQVTCINGLPRVLFAEYLDALIAKGTSEEQACIVIDKDLVQILSIEFMKRCFSEFGTDLGPVPRQDFIRSVHPYLEEICKACIPRFDIDAFVATYEPEEIFAQHELVHH